jgi:hypothetical protein
MLLMSDGALDAIEQRVRLWADYGDVQAARPEDALALLREVRELRDLRDHLIAMHRQARDRLAEIETEHAARGPA